MKAGGDKMKLVLEDGTELRGLNFGSEKAVAGEVVFNTAMTGYVETLTDPSYKGQILVMTYPLVGNYGVPSARDPASLESPYESSGIQVQGLVVQNYVEASGHYQATRPLGSWMQAEGIPGITGIDTRWLTRRLRKHGTMSGWLFPDTMTLEEAQTSALAVDMRDEVFNAVAPAEPVRYDGGELTIAVIDIGAKDNIIRSLLERGTTVLRVPWHVQLERYVMNADAVVVGNGPGDPKNLAPLVAQLRGVIASEEKPFFGICLGNQLLALAIGGNTNKMSYGHRGVNQPVQDLLTRRCYITSQNHGYAVEDGALPSGWEPWFVNTNDGTNEGIRSRSSPQFGVQFHPEASPGPMDTGFLFDDFLRLVGAMRRT